MFVICRLIEELVRVAKQQGCYKVILDCAESNVAFYEKCGLSRKEVQMVSGDKIAADGRWQQEAVANCVV
jgi:hypothetical protein